MFIYLFIQVLTLLVTPEKCSNWFDSQLMLTTSFSEELPSEFINIILIVLAMIIDLGFD